MKKTLILMVLIIPLTACGDLAPNGATITGPADSTDTLPRNTSETSVIYRSLNFIAKGQSGEVLSDIEMEFFRGGVDATVSLADSNGNTITAPSMKIKTDERGIARVGFVIRVPGCVTTADIPVSGSIFATVGSVSQLWKASVTRACATT
ncbi:hypothetical protein MNBD_NITROSPIRAE01-1223 [hydrothermal vent metagenome]|uniref:Uncharacterized protein n=1 Tax=hydrothermal vent metagenome TaxID=652676 RepID=A0A3B1CUD1_9ZZZZ